MQDINSNSLHSQHGSRHPGAHTGHRTRNKGAPFLAGPGLILSWVSFPSPAQEASTNTHRLCTADAIRLGGRGLLSSAPNTRLGSTPGAQNGAGVSLWSCACVLPPPQTQQDFAPRGRQLPAPCPGFGKWARSACRKRFAPQGSARLHGALHPAAHIPKSHPQGWVYIKQAAQHGRVS